MKISLTQNSIDYKRELEALAKFSNKEYRDYLVKSFGWYESDNCIFITMEYFEFGDLQKYLRVPLPFMHQDGFTHRDLKPANIFVVSRGPDWWLKVGDFGLTKCIDQGGTALRTMIGTPSYIAPVVLSGYCTVPGTGFSYTAAVDIWAVGVIVHHALSGQLPFKNLGLILAYAKEPNNYAFDLLHRQSGITEQRQNFVKELLCAKPMDRPSAKDALSHEWRNTPVSRRPSGNQSMSPPSPSGSIEASGRCSALAEDDLNLQTPFSALSMNQTRKKPSGDGRESPNPANRTKRHHKVQAQGPRKTSHALRGADNESSLPNAGIRYQDFERAAEVDARKLQDESPIGAMLSKDRARSSRRFTSTVATIGSEDDSIAKKSWPVGANKSKEDTPILKRNGRNVAARRRRESPEIPLFDLRLGEF
ncbi:kinase-like domain-containing protein [Aspergillus karnatakaensis]|uniref:kinase-like domain-containing protein n=1 Tax=Aspergillus karnatakaensis TaxID=1810916 RepID=UPI003CCE0FE9